MCVCGGCIVCVWGGGGRGAGKGAGLVIIEPIRRIRKIDFRVSRCKSGVFCV